MGKESQIDQFELSPLAQQKMQELLAVLAEDGFGDGGRPPKDTDFATIEEFGHQSGRSLARALDERLTERHAEHFQQSQSCPTCRALSDSTDPAKERSLQTRDGTVTLAEPAFHCPTCQRAFFVSVHFAAKGWSNGPCGVGGWVANRVKQGVRNLSRSPSNIPRICEASPGQ